jgi:hypothetical protein
MKQKLLILIALLPLGLSAHETATSGSALHGVEHSLLSLLPVAAVVGILVYCAWRAIRASR